MHPYASEKLAVRPFRIGAVSGFVLDAQGDLVLCCSEDGPCPNLWSDTKIEADPNFMCPDCGRISQRMEEASPTRCGSAAAARTARRRWS